MMIMIMIMIMLSEFNSYTRPQQLLLYHIKLNSVY